jgi:hypothetical protein
MDLTPWWPTSASSPIVTEGLIGLSHLLHGDAVFSVLSIELASSSSKLSNDFDVASPSRRRSARSILQDAIRCRELASAPGQRINEAPKCLGVA